MEHEADYEVYDRRFADLIEPGSGVETLADGCVWAEGPVWFNDGGYLVFSDIPNSRMLRWVPDAGVSTFRADSNFSNGNTRDRSGRLVTCEHGERRVTRTEPDGAITIIADRYQNRRLNSPNDVVVKSDGTIWFTDPTYGIISDHEGHKADQEQDGRYVYCADPVNGSLTVVADDFVQPNGLAFSPDESELYVADSAASHDPDAPHHIRRFKVGADNRLSGDEVFFDVSPGVPDGIRFDTQGNLWTSAKDGVICLAPSGDALGKIKIPAVVANLTFGGALRNRMFITATDRLFAVQLVVSGVQYP